MDILLGFSDPQTVCEHAWFNLKTGIYTLHVICLT